MDLTTNPSFSQPKLYQLDIINKMCRNDEEQVLKMIEVFIDQISQAIKEIETAYSENDFIKIKGLTHKMKPLLTYFGTSKLEQEFIVAEVLFSKEIASPEIELTISNLDSLAKDVIHEMKKDFNLTHK